MQFSALSANDHRKIDATLLAADNLKRL